MWAAAQMQHQQPQHQKQQLGHSLASNSCHSRPASQCYLCGGLSALANVAVSFPLNKIVFRQQLNNVTFAAAAKQVLKVELWSLYRGCLPPLLQRTCNLGAMFGCYSALSTQFPAAGRWGAACLTGACEAAFMPFERVQTLLQMQRPRYRGTGQAFAELLRLHGVAECYRGLSAVLVRNSCSTGLYFTLKERAQLAMPQGGAGCCESFIIGASLGALLSTLVYPLNVAKTHMQARVGGAFVSPFYALRCVQSDCGGGGGGSGVGVGSCLRRIFRGAPANSCRAMLSWGVITASYDFFSRRLFGDFSEL